MVVLEVQYRRFEVILAVFNAPSECALLLLAHNAPVKIKNAQGWSPLAEAISYGDRQMSKSTTSCGFTE